MFKLPLHQPSLKRIFKNLLGKNFPFPGSSLPSPRTPLLVAFLGWVQVRITTFYYNLAKNKDSRFNVSPCSSLSSGGRIRTSDLRVMSPTSYLAALPRDHYYCIFKILHSRCMLDFTLRCVNRTLAELLAELWI